MIFITPTLHINEANLSEEFIRSSGPGGQNVNKVATAVQLRFDAAQAALPPDILERLRSLAGNRMTDEGVIIIEARKFRTQERNRQEALERLIALLRNAAEPPPPRFKTRVPRRVKEHRLETKRQRSRLKQQRYKPRHDEK